MPSPNCAVKENRISMTVPPNNLPFLFAAFAVVWAVFFIYAAYMSWRRQSVQRELQELHTTDTPAAAPDSDDAAGSGPM